MRSNKNTGFLYYAERGAILDNRTDITLSHRQNPDVRQNPSRHLNRMLCLPAILRILYLALQNLCCESSRHHNKFSWCSFQNPDSNPTPNADRNCQVHENRYRREYEEVICRFEADIEGYTNHSSYQKQFESGSWADEFERNQKQSSGLEVLEEHQFWDQP